MGKRSMHGTRFSGFFFFLTTASASRCKAGMAQNMSVGKKKIEMQQVLPSLRTVGRACQCFPFVGHHGKNHSLCLCYPSSLNKVGALFGFNEGPGRGAAATHGDVDPRYQETLCASLLFLLVFSFLSPAVLPAHERGRASKRGGGAQKLNHLITCMQPFLAYSPCCR